MRICLLGNVPLPQVKDALIRGGHAVCAYGSVHEWVRDIEDYESVIYEFSPEAILVVFDVGFSERDMTSIERRDDCVAKIRERFPELPVVVPYVPRLSDRIGLTDFYDVRAFKTGREPFTEVGVQVIVECFGTLCNVHPCKAIAVADDFTIWADGIRDKKCKEIGKYPGFTKELRRFIEAGVPVVLVSHNHENEVARALTRWGMGVKYEYFRHLSCGHRTIKTALDDVCRRLDLQPDEIVFVSGSAEDRALARTFYPRMVVPPSVHEVELTHYLRDVVARCFPGCSIDVHRAEKELNYVRKREEEAKARWKLTTQQFRDKFMPISLFATKRVSGSVYEDIEYMKARSDVRSVNFCVTRTESELVPVLWSKDFRAWYVTARVGRLNRRVFMASVVAGIRDGKAKITDFLLNQEFVGYTVENAIMNYVRGKLHVEGVELVGFESGYGFEKTAFAIEVAKAIADGYGRDSKVLDLPTFCKWGIADGFR